jgi:DNA-binding transcriptional LysR family regulator
MRLNTAGELVVLHARAQIADSDRLRSQLEDLAGVRRGHVAIACSQAFADNVMPDEIHAYRIQHPGVDFTVHVRDHAHAVAALIDFDADIALVLQPPPAPELRLLYECRQPLCALMRQGHTLAGDGPVRLRDCLVHPLAMPGRSLAIRHALDVAILRAGLPLRVAVESDSLEFLRNYLRREGVVSFQVPSGIPADRVGICVRPIDGRDLAPMQLVLGQLRSRSLSIAAAKFADQIASNLEQRHGMVASGPPPIKAPSIAAGTCKGRS